MFSARRPSSRYLLALVAATAVSAGAAEGNSRVEMQRRSIVLVPTRGSLSAVCPSVHKIDGCSMFTGEKLLTRCESDRGKWRVEATVSVDVSIYLWKPSRLGHEDRHIRDLTSWLNEYVNAMSRVSFDTRETCEEWSTKKAEAFPSMLNALKQRSNELRDPVAYAADSSNKP